MNTPSAPPTPDPRAVASAQTAGNIQTAIANTVLSNANESSPYGSVRYSQNGNFTTVTDADGKTYNIPQFDRTVTLSPEQQALYNQQVSIGGKMNNLASNQIDKVGGILGSPIDTSKIPALVSSVNNPTFTGPVSTPTLLTSIASAGPIQRDVNLNTKAPTTFGQTAGDIQYNIGPNDFSKERNNVEAALLARLQPQLDNDRESLRTRLLNQGFQEGTTAFNDAMTRADRAATDARMSAILGAGQEQSRLFDLAYQQGAFNNAAQQQDYTQQQGRGLFGLQATDQNNNAILSKGNFVNAAQGQQYGQNANNATFQNTSLQQDYTNRQNAANIQNELSQRSFANAMENAALNNQTSNQTMQQMLALRQAPINEISALMSGGQVSAPQFDSYRPGNIAGTDIQGAIYNSAALDNQRYQADISQQNAMLGGLFGLGGSVALGGLGGAGGFRGLFGMGR